MKKAVVLYSGGLDSTTCLAIAHSEGYTPYALSFAYGQRHGVELQKAREYAPRIGAAEHVITSYSIHYTKLYDHRPRAPWGPRGPRSGRCRR